MEERETFVRHISMVPRLCVLPSALLYFSAFHVYFSNNKKEKRKKEIILVGLSLCCPVLTLRRLLLPSLLVSLSHVRLT